ncbi:hypothetical protein GCM10010377_69180 [Streptomyces viridiviolaceus]|nr:hypothetical protein GCM10010377_69180 [Streptomyces viridiviolaceus]
MKAEAFRRARRRLGGVLPVGAVQRVDLVPPQPDAPPVDDVVGHGPERQHGPGQVALLALRQPDAEFRHLTGIQSVASLCRLRNVVRRGDPRPRPPRLVRPLSRRLRHGPRHGGRVLSGVHTAAQALMGRPDTRCLGRQPVRQVPGLRQGTAPWSVGEVAECLGDPQQRPVLGLPQSDVLGVLADHRRRSQQRDRAVPPGAARAVGKGPLQFLLGSDRHRFAVPAGGSVGVAEAFGGQGAGEVVGVGRFVVGPRGGERLRSPEAFVGGEEVVPEAGCQLGHPVLVRRAVSAEPLEGTGRAAQGRADTRLEGEVRGQRPRLGGQDRVPAAQYTGQFVAGDGAVGEQRVKGGQQAFVQAGPGPGGLGLRQCLGTVGRAPPVELVREEPVRDGGHVTAGVPQGEPGVQPLGVGQLGVGGAPPFQPFLRGPGRCRGGVPGAEDPFEAGVDAGGHRDVQQAAQHRTDLGEVHREAVEEGGADLRSGLGPRRRGVRDGLLGPQDLRFPGRLDRQPGGQRPQQVAQPFEPLAGQRSPVGDETGHSGRGGEELLEPLPQRVAGLGQHPEPAGRGHGGVLRAEGRQQLPLLGAEPVVEGLREFLERAVQPGELPVQQGVPVELGRQGGDQLAQPAAGLPYRAVQAGTGIDAGERLAQRLLPAVAEAGRGLFTDRGGQLGGQLERRPRTVVEAVPPGLREALPPELEGPVEGGVPAVERHVTDRRQRERVAQFLRQRAPVRHGDLGDAAVVRQDAVPYLGELFLGQRRGPVPRPLGERLVEDPAAGVPGGLRPWPVAGHVGRVRPGAVGVGQQLRVVLVQFPLGRLPRGDTPVPRVGVRGGRYGLRHPRGLPGRAVRGVRLDLVDVRLAQCADVAACPLGGRRVRHADRIAGQVAQPAREVLLGAVPRFGDLVQGRGLLTEAGQGLGPCPGSEAVQAPGQGLDEGPALLFVPGGELAAPVPVGREAGGVLGQAPVLRDRLGRPPLLVERGLAGVPSHPVQPLCALLGVLDRRHRGPLGGMALPQGRQLPLVPPLYGGSPLGPALGQVGLTAVRAGGAQRGVEGRPRLPVLEPGVVGVGVPLPELLRQCLRGPLDGRAGLLELLDHRRGLRRGGEGRAVAAGQGGGDVPLEDLTRPCAGRQVVAYRGELPGEVVEGCRAGGGQLGRPGGGAVRGPGVGERLANGRDPVHRLR